MTDFTGCRIVPGRAYNGANGSKIAIEYNKEIYMQNFLHLSVSYLCHQAEWSKNKLL